MHIHSAIAGTYQDYLATLCREHNDAMKVYNAWAGPMPQLPSVVVTPPVRLLVSFAYDQRNTLVGKKVASLIPLDEVDLMIDSGAFSVWTVGDTIDLDAYIEWAKAQRALVPDATIINLDVIPGAPGVRPSQKEAEKAIAQSMENADRIRDAGLPVMEVFHLHDLDFGLMEKLWERRQPGEVLGIGGLAGLGTSRTELLAFGDQVFARVRDWSGGWENIVKVHGLGISPDSPMCRRYPWWSIDSSSWNTFQRYGRDVSQNGRSQTGTMLPGGGSRRTSARPVTDLYYLRITRRWKRLEAELTAMWERRGVTFAEERTAV